MKRLGFVLIFILGLILVASVPALADDSPCSNSDAICPDVPESQGNQGDGSIVTTGADFPGAEMGSDVFKASQKNKGCTDCEWSVVPACSVNGPTESGVLCMGALATCADPAAIRYRVYLRRGDGPRVVQGTVCLRPDERPPTVADVGVLHLRRAWRA